MAKRSAILFCLLLLACAAFAETYPKIDTSGYKKWEFRDAAVSPRSNYVQGISYLGGYTGNVTGDPWQERLQLKLHTKLSEKLTVTYDIDQQPDVPQRYDVKINYDNKHEVTFGDFSASFSGNEFAQATRVLDGMMITSKDENYEMIAVPSAKLKSHFQGYTTQNGNNTRGPYSLGHGSIVEGTEQIELNGDPLKKSQDYVIDYYEGKITFSRILTEDDEFSYSYEYTNVSDLFFPALSNNSFYGFQGRVKIDPATFGKEEEKPEEIILERMEIFPRGTATEEESAGRYQLGRYPVVFFSETVVFKSNRLRKDVDYKINYGSGTISVLLPSLPDKENPLSVQYEYKKTEVIVELLPGSGSRGPYVLVNRNLIAQTDQVFIDDNLVVRDLDYKINYKDGRIMFNFEVPNTAAIRVKYKYVLLSILKPPETPKYKQNLTLGMTYLKETAKTGLGLATENYTEPQPFEGSDIIKNNNTLYLSRYPVVPTSEGGTLLLSLNGSALTYGIDYVIPTVEADPQTGYAKVIPEARLAYINDRSDLTDGFGTGTIKFLTPVSASDKVRATYTYRKSVVGRFAGAGNGSRGPYYIYGYRDLVPGTEVVEVWQTNSNNSLKVYTRNSSFEPDAGDTGYSINYYKENPYITFNKELSSDQNFSAYFQYVPPSTLIGGTLTKDLTGFDVDYKFGELLELNTNIARSHSDVVTITKSTIEAAIFTPPTNKVSVIKHNTPAITEDSEKVYVNGYLRNRDEDYNIDYVNGEIFFYYITLGTSDAVRVEYEYPDPGGIAQTGSKADSAYKYSIKTDLDSVTLAYDEKGIGKDFTALGSTLIGTGSNQRNFSAGYSPGFHSLSMNFRYRDANDPIATSDLPDSYTHNYDRSFSMGMNPFGLGQVAFGFRNLETRGDPTATGEVLSANRDLKEYSGSYTLPAFQFLALSYDQKYDGKLTDSRDLLNNTFSRTKYFHLDHSLTLPRITGGVDFAISEPYTIENYLTTQETRSKWSTTRDLTYKAAIDLTYWPLKSWTAYAKLINHEVLTHLPAASRLHTRNTTYHSDMKPIDQMWLTYHYTRDETPSIIVEGKNPKKEKTSGKVYLTPLSYFSCAWEHAEDSTIFESGRESSGFSDTYTSDWNIYSADSIRLDSNFKKYNRISRGPSGTLESVRTDTNTFTQSYTLTWTPFSELSIAPGYSQEDYKYESEIQKTLIALGKTVKCKVNYTPIPQFEATGDYHLKITSAAGVAARHKATINSNIKYRIFEWGELVLEQNEEFNQGEVYADGTFPALDFVKIFRAVGIYVTVPQENPLLSSVVLSLNYRLVNYDNKLPGGDADDLTAYSLVYETTLNF